MRNSQLRAFFVALVAIGLTTLAVRPAEAAKNRRRAPPPDEQLTPAYAPDLAPPEMPALPPPADAPAEPADAVTAAAPLPAESEAASWERPMARFVIGARVGGLFGQPFSELGSALIPELSFAWHPDLWMRRLGIMFAMSYSQPEAEEVHVDPRLTENGGLMIYRHTLRDFAMTLAPTLWFPVGTTVVPYASAGVKMHLYRNEVQGSTGSESLFGENREPKTRAGFVGRLGLGIMLGPGAVTADVTLDAAPVNETTTGDANAGDIIVSVGYSLFL